MAAAPIRPWQAMALLASVIFTLARITNSDRRLTRPAMSSREQTSRNSFSAGRVMMKLALMRPFGVQKAARPAGPPGRISSTSCVSCACRNLAASSPLARSTPSMGRGQAPSAEKAKNGARRAGGAEGIWGAGAVMR